MTAKLIVYQSVLLILSVTLIYYRLSLGISPRQYKAFGGSLNQPLALAPLWVIRAVGVLLGVVGLAFFIAFLSKRPSR